ncbi:MAG: hypothetical protein PHQ30_04755 [Candidatus Izemoplasmatales bacterium]|nr:hypothetical protein [Candidatus Izemoplasmatales bacterium]
MYVLIAIFVVIIAGLVFGEVKWGILRTVYNPTKRSHQFISMLAILPCLVLSGLFYAYISDPVSDPVAYPLTQGVNRYNPYIQQFDAFQKGQLFIDYEVSEELNALDNPYDPNQRIGIYYLWDRALYESHYYSYFGIAPILVVYYPYYLVTGNLPSDAFVGLFFMLLITFFVPLIILDLAKRILKKTPLSLLCLAMVAATFGTNVFLAARGVQPYYYIAILSGMAFLAIFLFLFIKGLSSVKFSGFVYLFGAGIAYGLLFLSRVNMAILAIFIIVPSLLFYVFRLTNGKRIIGKKTLGLLSLATPVVITLVFSCWFNDARFSSPWDFGNSYQLTVSDVSKNTLHIKDLGLSIYYYGFQNLELSNQYSYITFTYNTFENYDYFIYSDASMSLLVTPLMIGLLLSPFIIFNRKYSVFLRIIFPAILLGICFVAWLNFSLGGLIFRYTLDLCLIGTLTSTIGLLLIFERIRESRHKWIQYTGGGLLALLFLTSSIVSLQIALITNGNLIVIKESVIAFLETVLPFLNLMG